MEAAGRHICLLSDNCPSHLKFKQEDYPYVRVVFFPPNMTSHIQPMDAGIIRTFKAHYRRLRVQCILDRHEDEEENINALDQLESMHMIHEAWNSITPETVRNCWHHTGILGRASDDNDGPSHPKAPTQEEKAVADLNRTLDIFNANHAAKNDTLTADEWLDMADEKITEGAWTDEDLLEQYKIDKREAAGEHIFELEVDTESKDSESLPIVSLTQALESLEICDQFLHENPSLESNKALTVHRKLKRELRRAYNSTLKQTTLKF